MNGREIQIRANGKDVLEQFKDIKFEMEDDISLGISSTFEKQVFEASQAAQSAATLVSVVGNLMKNEKLARTTLQESMMTARVWGGSAPITINFTSTFHVGINGKYDPYMQVYGPIMALAKLPLPWVENNFLMAPGTVSGDIVAKAAAEVLKDNLHINVSSQVTSTIYAITIGNVLDLDWIVVERADPVFSKQMAKGIAPDGKVGYYPIHGSINMTISTIRAGSRDMLQRTDRTAKS